MIGGRIAMVNRLLAGAAFSLGLLAASGASAWTPPQVGAACKGARGPGPKLTAIAGNYLGGRHIRDGIVDWKSFQGCFRTAEACEIWLAGQARRFPVTPSRATCVSVTLR
ncbi:hypothetical protein [Rhabdaerophilum calidifontis]|uniref:hypothetical protein n=1 Tax=Rhabdaerophilum calidifontis TaxID=2604328 RepID=UPI0019806237|nr:hypothetical protein [Rhabdaerophilum calidifontis]